MNKLYTAVAAAVLAIGAAPAMTTTAEAHQRGDVCRYQSIDRNGNVRTSTDYCHHLPSQYRQAPRTGFTLYFDFADGFYVDRQPRRVRGDRQEQVCLVTFFKRSQVAGGADANVQRAQILPRRQAERLDGPNDRQRIFDYGSDRKTRQTCRYLDRLNR